MHNPSLTHLFIENVAKADVPTGNHFDCGQRSMLISINDPACEPPQPKHKFSEVHVFEFLDLEGNEGYGEEFLCTPEDAQRLVSLLQHALDERLHVVVHCTAGVCRSGAVVEVAEMMGFTPVERFRAPNMLVKHRMLRALGWYYEDETR